MIRQRVQRGGFGGTPGVDSATPTPRVETGIRQSQRRSSSVDSRNSVAAEHSSFEEGDKHGKLDQLYNIRYEVFYIAEEPYIYILSDTSWNITKSAGAKWTNQIYLRS